MTIINGVVQGCARSEKIVCLLDVLIEAEVEHYDTVAQMKGAINNKIDDLRSEGNAK